MVDKKKKAKNTTGKANPVIGTNIGDFLSEDSLASYLGGAPTDEQLAALEAAKAAMGKQPSKEDLSETAQILGREVGAKYPHISKDEAGGYNQNNLVADRLRRALGPETEEARYGEGAPGYLREVGYSLSPEYSLERSKTMKEEEEAAFKLAKLKGTMSATQKKLSDANFMKVQTEGSNLLRAREGTKKLRYWYMNRHLEEAKFTPFWQKMKGLRNNFQTIVREIMYTRGIDQASAQSAYWTVVNGYIKQITGAQMSEHEARRIMRAFPRWADDPQVFMKVWDDIMVDRESAWRMMYNGFKAANYSGWEGLTSTYNTLVANPYRRTVFPKTKKRVAAKVVSKKRGKIKLKKFNSKNLGKKKGK